MGNIHTSCKANKKMILKNMKFMNFSTNNNISFSVSGLTMVTEKLFTEHNDNF